MAAENIGLILNNVEKFLLPKGRDAQLEGLRDKSALSPRARLQNTCFTTMLGDHIRVMQTMYKDFEDELNLFSEIRDGETANTSIPTALVQEKITEGNARIVALCRMCYGDNSLEMIRAIADLAASYAQQGLWVQAKDHIDSALLRFHQQNFRVKQDDINQRTQIAQDAATKVRVIFSTLRDHVSVNFGRVTKTFINEAVSKLKEVNANLDCENPNDSSPHAMIMRTFQSQVAEYLASYKPEKISNQVEGLSSPSWGAFLDFLRRDCSAMRILTDLMEDGLLPQNRAALELPFRMCDQLQKGIAHSVQLSENITKFPCALRAITSENVLTELKKLKTEVTLHIDPDINDVVDIQHYKGLGEEPQSVTYELPITWEEFISSVVIDDFVDVVSMEHGRILSLHGVCEIFSGNVANAESNVRDALRVVEKIGMEMDISACDLYNAIAQLMVVKYRQVETRRKDRVKKATAAWLSTGDGNKALRDRIRAIRLEATKRGINVPLDEAEARAKQYLLRNKSAELRAHIEMQQQEADPADKTLEAAYRYLVRSYDILEEAHGAQHIALATAALAVASVQNLAQQFSDAREWLSRALRCMEKITPQPQRLIAFTQIQLSQVLTKEGHYDQSMNVLMTASNFYMKRALDGLDRHQKANPADPYLMKPLIKGNQLHDDVHLAIELMSRLARMSYQRGDKVTGLDQAEAVAEMKENAFGMDSIEAAVARKDTGSKCLNMMDFPRAIMNLRKAYDAYELLFGSADAHCVEVNELLHAAHAKRQRPAGRPESAPMKKNLTLLQADVDFLIHSASPERTASGFPVSSSDHMRNTYRSRGTKIAQYTAEKGPGPQFPAASRPSRPTALSAFDGSVPAEERKESAVMLSKDLDDPTSPLDSPQPPESGKHFNNRSSSRERDRGSSLSPSRGKPKPSFHVIVDPLTKQTAQRKSKEIMEVYRDSVKLAR